MQPTFLPWAGYFGLMDYVDEFVFLDHVAFDKRSWQQRNQIRCGDKSQWLTVPVNATQGQTIDTITIASNLCKMARSITANYVNTPYYFDYGRPVVNIIGQDHKYLCSLNFQIIEYFVRVLGIKTRLSCSSQIGAVGSKSELLANICRIKGATEYVSPPGSKDYLDPSAFDTPVNYFEYNHPVYRQKGEFIPYLSVLDLLCNEGPESMDIIRRGYEENTPDAR